MKSWFRLTVFHIGAEMPDFVIYRVAEVLDALLIARIAKIQHCFDRPLEYRGFAIGNVQGCK